MITSSSQQGGANFNYSLLFVIFLSNMCAILLQYLCVKLGVVTNMDLAQACRKYFHPYINFVLYIFCEIAIIACDLAEIIGTAIALNLLFNLPLPWGVAITGLDVFVVMLLWGSEKAIRYFEIVIIILVSVVACCFFALVNRSPVNWGQVGLGILPNGGLLSKDALFNALGIMGATIMVKKK
jgi:manganese transport protein